MIMTLPVALGGWIFGKKGVIINLFSYQVLLRLYNLYMYHTLGGSHPQNGSSALVGNMLVMIAVGATAVSLRTTFQHEEEARHRMEEMERLTRLASEQQRQLYQTKMQFMLNVNHELRTPLAAAYSYFELLQLLMEQQNSLATETYTMYIKHALRYCEDLRSMVNNVLDTMDIDCPHKPLKSRQCFLEQVILDTCEHANAVQREKQRIYITIPSDLTVFANPLYVRGILYQLLTNAIKFSPENAPIFISASLLPGEDEVCISIRDQGPGIPTDEIPQLFDQFVRLKRDIAGTIRGSGLGLYICKHLVETMHGRIWVESSGCPNEGSCFHFTLPVNPINTVPQLAQPA
jgi:signal transduction histidine kinase